MNFWRMQNPKIFQKISKSKIFEIFENIKFFKKIQNFQISQSQSPSQSSKSVTWFFYRNAKNIWDQKFWGPAEISGIVGLLDVMLNIQAGQKNQLFSKKLRFCFFHPEGPGTRNFCQAILVSMLLKTKIVDEIGNRCCFCSHIRSQEVFEWIYRGKKGFWEAPSILSNFDDMILATQHRSARKINFKTLAHFWGSYIVIFGKTCSLWRESHFFQKAHFLPWETTQNITTDSPKIGIIPRFVSRYFLPA